MPPDRFDDVEFRILEQPEPRPRHRRRWVAAAAAGIVAAGGLAAGASALTGDEDPAPAAKPPALEIRFQHHHRGGHDCHRGEHRASPDTSGVRY
jgi:hypothetical protein